MAGAELSTKRIAEREDLSESKSLVMTFFRNCVRDSDLARAWRSVVGDSDEAPVFVDETAPEAIEKVMHQTVIKVTSDIEKMSFNTAISQLMIFNNEMMKMDKRYREPCETFVKLLHPFAPHIAEEMWSILGHNESLTTVVKSIVVPGKLVNIVVK